jgi:TolB protein
LKRLFLILILIISNNIFSILEIEIIKGSDNLSKIAFVPFAVNEGLELSQGENLAKLIERNMLLFGEFENLDKAEMLAFPSLEEDFFYRDWKIQGVDFSVIGKINSVNILGNLNISYTLFNINRRIKVLEGEIVGSENNIDGIAKIISNRIYEKITGLKGIFDTKLAYVINSDSDTYQMCISDIDGKNERILFTSKSPIMSPDWSPDRKKIAYVSFENGIAEIFIQDLKTGERDSIQALGMTNSAPVWSPDGKSLALVVSFSGNPDIFLYSIASKSLSRLTNHYAIDTEPSWSPDSKKIIFTSDRSGSPQLYEINTSSKRQKRLTRDGTYNARGRYFPDGKSIFFVHGNNSNFQIATKKLSSRFIETLTSTSLDESPTISPNGNVIIYATKKGSKGYLGGITLNGKSRFSLPVKNGSVREPAWSPLVNN